jgi:23S rRNA (adenine2030-N6)-methyltransferase
MRFELAVEAVRNEGPLSATGLIVVNPPFTLEEQARRLLPVLAKVMARGAGAQALVEIISDETLA